MKVGSKILITGGTGMLGTSLYFLWKDHYDLHFISRGRPTIDGMRSYRVDLTQAQEVMGLVKRIAPEYIVHTAALTNVDYCEDHSEEAHRNNVGATENVALAARETRTPIVYISTDFVFDGVRGNYREEDATNPLSVYGRTKLGGEDVVRRSGLDFLILRTSIYGWNILPKESFVEAVVNRLRLGQTFTPFEDQYGTPVHTETLGDMIKRLLERKKLGIYHVSSEPTSKYAWALIVANEFSLDSHLLQPRSIKGVTMRAARPVNATLLSTKLCRDLGVDPIAIHSDVKRMHEQEALYGQYKKTREEK